MGELRADNRVVIPIHRSTVNVDKTKRGTTDTITDESLHPHLSGEEENS